MDCEQILPRLENYLHTELEPTLMRIVQLHLAACAACRQEMAQRRATADAVVPFYLAALAHDELTPAERCRVEEHLAWCAACREEAEGLAGAAAEMKKILSQHQLPADFRRQVMAAWRPHHLGKRPPAELRGLADAIARAEAGGNVFSYERLTEKYKDFVYASAFLTCGDFASAAEIARRLFVAGMPLFQYNIGPAEWRGWLAERAAALARQCLAGEDEDRADGLAGFRASRKLRRYRLFASLAGALPDEQRLPFFLYYVQRRSYQEIAAMLDLERPKVMAFLLDATHAGQQAIAADESATTAGAADERRATAKENP